MIRILALTSLLLGPLGAWEPAFGLQLGLNRTRHQGVDLSASSGNLAVDADPQQGPLVRGLFDVRLGDGWFLETSLGWRGRSSSGLHYRGDHAGTGDLDAVLVMKEQVMLGALVSRGIPHAGGAWSAGLGIDLRQDQIALEVHKGTSGTRLVRPWLRSALRWSGRGSGRGFAGLEIAIPLSRPGVTAENYLSDLDRLDAGVNPAAGSAARAHAPTSEWSVVFGLRFPGGVP